MLKKGLSVFVVLLGITLIVIGYYYFFSNNNKLLTANDALSNMSFVVRVNNIDKSIANINSSEYFKFTEEPEYLKLIKFISRKKQEKKIKDVFVTSFKESIAHPIFCIESYSYSQSEKFIDKFTKLYGKGKFRLTKESKFSYYKHNCKNGNSIYVSMYNGLVFISGNLKSFSKLLLKVKDISVSNNNPRYFKTASREADFNIYIQNKLFWTSVFSSSVFNKKKLIFNTAVFDVYLKKKVAVISGLIKAGDSKLFKSIVSSSPITFKLSELAKENVSICKQITLNKIFSKNVGNIKFKGSFFNELYKQSLKNTIISFDVGEVLAFGLNSPSETKNWLRNWSSKAKNSAKKYTYKFDKSTEFLIVNADFYKQFPTLPNEVFNIGKVKYCTIIKNYIVFATKLSELKLICSNSVLKQNLRTSSKYKNIEHYLSSASNLFLYGNIKKNLENSVFAKSISELFSLGGLLNNLSDFAVQLSGSNGYLYLNLIIDSNLKKELHSNVKWKSKLDGNAVVKPVIVINHITSENEIIIQDNRNILYLLNNKGRILWRKPLKERVISDFYQVDKYKNRKLQYLFNTKSSLYLVDRNGNDVERFPKKFLHQATAGINVFDYDKNKNYRIFVPLENRKIVLYDIDGNTVPGWQFDKTDANVTTPIQYFRIGTRDYIIFGDTVRTYILNRKGKSRIIPDGKSSKSSNNIYYFDKYAGKWVTTMPDGSVLNISIIGNITHKSLLKCNNEHHFVYADISGDNKCEYVYLNSDILNVYSSKGKEKFSYRFKNSIEEPPFIYKFSSLVKGVGVVDKIDSKVYMFDKLGKQFKGFPYSGVTPFTISHINGYKGLQLIVGHSDGFLYDYQLP